MLDVLDKGLNQPVPIAGGGDRFKGLVDTLPPEIIAAVIYRHDKWFLGVKDEFLQSAGDAFHRVFRQGPFKSKFLGVYRVHKDRRAGQ